ncbi:MAG: hypothetical protein QNK27_10375 [Desulfuromusa sp.]|nr:hypothetical protein [Desulfuromusa sp.]
MNDQKEKDPNLQCITAIAPTICKLMGIAPPALSDKRFLGEVVEAAKRDGIATVEKCLVYAPDAVGLQMYQDFRSLFDVVLRHAPIAVPLCAVIPPITPVCFASMFTGAQPRDHGLQKKGKPVLTCDTLFDALIRAGKRVAIVSVKEQSMDLIFRKRKIHYFSEPDDQAVTHRTIEIIKSDNYDFIVAYHCEYDDILHEKTHYCTEAIQALRNDIAAFTQLADTMDVIWQRNNRAIVFAPDHGAHIDPESGKGTHGINIPQDMHIQHYFGIKGST